MDSSSSSSIDDHSFIRQAASREPGYGATTPNEDAIGNHLAITADTGKSASAISLRAFLLGLVLGVSLALTLLAVQQPLNPLWRASTFLATLSFFHFLEFYITARYNPRAATISAFLLSQNGYAYNVAHTLAFLECLFRHYVAKIYFPGQVYLQPFDAILPGGRLAKTAWLTLGFAMLAIGQGTRTLAMVHAGTNFNHLVQSRKKEGHILVTGGIYGWLRHPSYFGFFWWGLGTQVVMGNVGCLFGYAVVLWRFFRYREEKLLVGFFGLDYVRYRDKTTVAIPLIR
ncbi:MAG: hypothetical protein LQ352_001225 [Teloschistes flavicans]|nr:MAG: hypothetical protein LQ352_001225 [Teloschistes flavicans]